MIRPLTHTGSPMPPTGRRLSIAVGTAASIVLAACSGTSMQESTGAPYAAAAANAATLAPSRTASFVTDADLAMEPPSPGPAAAAPVARVQAASFVTDADLAMELSPAAPAADAVTMSSIDRELGTASDGGYAVYAAQQ